MIKESIKKRHIVKYLFFSIICVSLQGCLYYNYGVRKDQPSLKYKPDYYGAEKGKYEFESVIYALENRPEHKDNSNHLRFHISIVHLYKPLQLDPEYKKDYISEIIFEHSIYNDDVEVILLPDTIKLIHMTEEGKIIPSKAVSHNLNKWTDDKYIFCRYKKVYEPKLVPKKLIESVSLEIIVDGEKVKIEYEFPIEKKFDYSWWDVMKGI